MAVRLATATVNAMADAAVDLIDVGGVGTIKIYSGTQPTTANDAVGAGTLLATFPLEDPAFGAASGGVATLAGTPLVTTGVAAGTAAWFRCATSSPSTVFDGSVSTSSGSGQLILNTVTISIDVNIEVTAGTFTMPAS